MVRLMVADITFYSCLTAIVVQVSDLKVLQGLIMSVSQLDSVSFFHYLRTLRASDTAYNTNAYWLYVDATDDLFVNAQQRVYTSIKEKVRVC